MTSKKSSKRENCLMAFLRKGKKGLNSMETALGVEYFSTCLNTDVSELSNRFGIKFDKRSESVPFQGGHTASFVRYSLASRQEAEKAIELVNHYRRKRNESKLADFEVAYFIGQLN